MKRWVLATVLLCCIPALTQTTGPKSAPDPWMVATGILTAAVLVVSAAWFWRTTDPLRQKARDFGAAATQRMVSRHRHSRWLLAAVAAGAFMAGWALHPSPKPRYSAYKYGLLFDRYTGAVCTPTFNGKATPNSFAPPCQARGITSTDELARALQVSRQAMAIRLEYRERERQRRHPSGTY